MFIAYKHRSQIDSLIKSIVSLQKDKISKIVAARMQEFKANGQEPETIFSELCFCICTANNSAERGLRAQKEIDFCNLSEPELRKKMREIVCRFYNNKTDYILDAKESKNDLFHTLKQAKNGKDAREWIVQNISGLGFKEASHFLRNIGYGDVAIIDFHIIDLLAWNKVIQRPKTLTHSKYLEIERILEKIAEEAHMNLAELDLYLWYLETGKLLK